MGFDFKEAKHIKDLNCIGLIAEEKQREQRKNLIP